MTAWSSGQGLSPRSTSLACPVPRTQPTTHNPLPPNPGASLTPRQDTIVTSRNPGGFVLLLVHLLPLPTFTCSLWTLPGPRRVPLPICVAPASPLPSPAQPLPAPCSTISGESAEHVQAPFTLTPREAGGGPTGEGCWCWSPRARGGPGLVLSVAQSWSNACSPRIKCPSWEVGLAAPAHPPRRLCWAMEPRAQIPSLEPAGHEKLLRDSRATCEGVMLPPGPTALGSIAHSRHPDPRPPVS